MRTCGHGRCTKLAADEALAIARNSHSVAVPAVERTAWPRLAENTRVSVTPQDYGAVPVLGQLLCLSHAEVAIRREDPLAGEVVVHFPRRGYIVEAA